MKCNSIYLYELQICTSIGMFVWSLVWYVGMCVRVYVLTSYSSGSSNDDICSQHIPRKICNLVSVIS